MIGSGCGVPFIGSGMSWATGKPTWARFLRETCTFAKGFSTVELEVMLAGGDFEGAASRLLGAMPKRLFNERFESCFSLTAEQPLKGPVRLIPLLFDSTAITTNFDGILERAYGEQNLPFQVSLHGMAVGDYRRKVVSGQRCLLKLHGNSSDAHGRVLTREEYDAFYQSGTNGREELAHIFRSGGLVFFGCSLTLDRTMLLLQEIANADSNMPRHYAIHQLPADADEMKEREHFLTERGIFPVWYDGDHDSDIEALLVGLMEDLKKL